MHRVMLVVLLAFLAFQICAFARIGETLAQCEARYGRGDEMPNGYSKFRKAGFVIMTHLYQGKVDQIQYRKEEGVLTDVEIREFLKANGGDRKWEEIIDSGRTRFWAIKDWEFTAFSASEGVFSSDLIISTKECRERSEQKRRAEEAKRLEETKRNLEGF